MKTLHVESVAQWRDWLDENHASAPEVWLVFAKHHTGVASIDFPDGSGTDTSTTAGVVQVCCDRLKGRDEMKGSLEKAFGYQGDNMNLPVPALSAALPFYENVLGFHVLSRSETPHRSAVLGRDAVQVGLAENGGDPTQDGCAFHVSNLESLYSEFQANGLGKALSQFDVERRDGESWRVFYVVAPDGLCYWFGEREPEARP